MKKRCVLLALLMALAFAAAPGDAAVLAWGSRGEQVALAQQRLRQFGYLSSEADGVFGQATYDAVVAFQRKNGLTADGRLGRATAEALGISLEGGVLSAELWQETELALLARLVSGEARGEPYVGEVAVAAVVLNRVRHDAFPDTISGVIFQAGAFDAVWDGQFDQTPTDSARRAARDAMTGWDPTGGCVYYYNPVTATNPWIWTRQVQLTIGEHAFAI